METKYHYINGIAPLSSTAQADGVNILEELIADEGKRLTQNEYNIPIQERIIASRVMLGKGRSKDEWIEITQEEADKILREQEEIREREMESLTNAHEE